ncbi:vacuolar protein sorting-associated protein 45 [Lepeophtheirus salmonis]|uniref:Uncharacterized protein n=1 Tax=Lepeophtheirus salmonis TaxID=72036 RepID=A0A0K2TC61_LEPSM|nr:vacuolar protein sorting-associated protein 45-like [Lepeophtheirus salmonis]
MTLNLPDLIRQSLFDELDAIKGMKTLIMDSVTMGIIDLACSKSLIMKKEVFLFEDVTKFRQGRKRYKDPKLSHLKAIVVIRNVNENIEALIYELSNNSYNSYHLFFTNRIDSMTIKRLAEADMNEVVKGVKEIYMDIEPLLNNVFMLKPLEGVTKFNYKSADIKRFSEGLSAATKLLRMTSSSILYQSTSLETDRIAHSLSSSLESSNGFSDEGVILILDRRFDPITPLVFNWTYFNLIHELLGFNNNKVTFTDSSSKTTQTSFSTDGDEFYKQNIYADYGKFCSSIKRLVDDFQKRRNEHDNMDSLGDIKDFISRYPEFKKLSGIVDKHVSIVDEIAKKVQMRDLLNISLLEQEILVSSNQSSIVNKLKRDLFPPPSQAENTNIQRSDLFRMLLITALKLKDISFLSQIQASDVNTADISCINEYIGRNFELFQKDNRIYPVSSNIINEFKTVENVYTRYQPRLKDVLNAVINGDIHHLNLNRYGNYSPSKKILVFVVGGLTCSEIALVHDLNKEQRARIVVGGTSLLNSECFMKDIIQTARATVPK